MERPKKILIAGACYIFHLLSMKLRRKPILNLSITQPDFDVDRVRFCDFDNIFEVADLRKYPDLVSLLRAYENRCSSMYLLLGFAWDAKKGLSDYGKWKPRLASFDNQWSVKYNIVDPEWDCRTATEFRKMRDSTIRQALFGFPSMKFILIYEGDIQEWERLDLPVNRRIFWKVDWGIKEQDLTEINHEMHVRGLKGVHAYPTEASYNELYFQLIADDAKNPILL